LVREHGANKGEHAVGLELAVARVRRHYRNPVSREFAIRLASSTATTR
jgi:hypothetical protein